MTDLSRVANFQQKKGVSVFTGIVKEGTEPGQIAVTSGNHLLGYLPPDAIITNAYVYVKTDSDATTVVGTLGTASAGTQIMSAADLDAAAGKTGTFTGMSLTGSGVAVWFGITYTGSPTAIGEYIVVIEYLEYFKATGELTKI
jgi:hypothetical protein